MGRGKGNKNKRRERAQARNNRNRPEPKCKIVLLANCIVRTHRRNLSCNNCLIKGRLTA